MRGLETSVLKESISSVGETCLKLPSLFVRKDGAFLSVKGLWVVVLVLSILIFPVSSISSCSFSWCLEQYSRFCTSVFQQLSPSHEKKSGVWLERAACLHSMSCFCVTSWSFACQECTLVLCFTSDPSYDVTRPLIALVDFCSVLALVSMFGAVADLDAQSFC